MRGTGLLRRFGPLLASKYSGRVFVNRIGSGASTDVETVDEISCLPEERGYLDDAVRWLRDGRP